MVKRSALLVLAACLGACAGEATDPAGSESDITEGPGLASAAAPEEASIVFDASGAPQLSGVLRAGEKVTIRYSQERLAECAQSQAGTPRWSISGFYSLGGSQPKSFATGRADGANLVTKDAVLDLGRAGELTLWFSSTSVTGCHEEDDNRGAKYTFAVE